MNPHVLRTLAALVLILSQVGSSQAAYSPAGAAPGSLPAAEDIAPASARQLDGTVLYLPLVARESRPGYFDDFSNPNSGWPAGEDGELLIEYLNGEYRVLVKPVDYFLAVRSPAGDWQDYTVEAEARWAANSGAGYGLAFGIEGDLDRFYAFLVNSDDQEYALLRYELGSWTVLRGFTSSSAIHPGAQTNRMGVIPDGSTIRLTINGLWVDVFGLALTGPTGVGLIVATYQNLPNADARFDNFSIVGEPSSGVTSVDRMASTGPSRSAAAEQLAAPMPGALSRQMERRLPGDAPP